MTDYDEELPAVIKTRSGLYLPALYDVYTQSGGHLVLDMGCDYGRWHLTRQPAPDAEPMWFDAPRGAVIRTVLDTPRVGERLNVEFSNGSYLVGNDTYSSSKVTRIVLRRVKKGYTRPSRGVTDAP